MRSAILSSVVVLLLAVSTGRAQLSQDARFAILGKMIATEGAARIPLPLGKTGVEISNLGLVDRTRLQKELSENGSAIEVGKVVIITAIEFSDKEIEFEIDNGGTVKKGFLSRINLSVGGAVNSQQPQQPERQAKGSKITLKFDSKIPPDLSVERLRDLLNPILDFNKQSLARAGVDALLPEFQDAVIAKEAKIGMDENTVLLALGQPNKRNRETNSEGIEQIDWIYRGRGNRQTFVTFENGIVVSIRQYE